MYSYKYPRSALTTDAIVFVKDKGTFVLLIQRKAEPYRNMWALPGGFIEIDETLENACKRELLEETGLELERMTQFKTYDSVDRDPRQRTISIIHFAELNTKQKVVGGDDAAQAKWFSLDKLPKLAFDHQLIITDFFHV